MIILEEFNTSFVFVIFLLLSILAFGVYIIIVIIYNNVSLVKRSIDSYINDKAIRNFLFIVLSYVITLLILYLNQKFTGRGLLE